MGVSEAKQQALLLVGASGGVGAALLEYLSSRTSLVCIPTYYRNKPQASHFFWIHYNSREIESTRVMLEEISREYNVVLIIDASGEFFASKIQRSSAQDIAGVISTNLIAPLILAKNAQEFMQVGGKVVFMSSIVSTMQITGSSVYAASKAGLERGVLALSSEFSETGHGICGIRLGYMDYGMTYKINEKTRKEISEKLSDKKFLNISALGEKILEIINSETHKVNGMLYEVK
jgi:NAD(P)-dependent dehydrogenase (short-subunit alcohol dehydrogenase family)